MAGFKHSREGDAITQMEESRSSPILPMFTDFRNELDEHYDRRERIIKTTRDITGSSKKM